MYRARQQGRVSQHVFGRPDHLRPLFPALYALLRAVAACLFSPQFFCCHASICLSFMEISSSCWTMCDLDSTPFPRGMAVQPCQQSDTFSRHQCSANCFSGRPHAQGWSQQLATFCCTFRLGSTSLGIWLWLAGFRQESQWVKAAHSCMRMMMNASWAQVYARHWCRAERQMHCRACQTGWRTSSGWLSLKSPRATLQLSTRLRPLCCPPS